ncbi:MAG: DUF6270 domain-containing protein [Phenylobacterium sp.]|uniref:DUF6270 domain-containing protein n=1 Tax=Phenylobacterium sp. TaxID=1871053 RepID=UPI00271D6B8F|nr:DUF6270 domain-containing protein [Phenylobacterium sp.]MDO8900635.1 DUF6270 domain-containing protein [Phenylobacterium sp.]
MAKIAIVGSCITRDLWPLREAAPPGLLYVSRTSLASLLSQPVDGYAPQSGPPADLTRYQHMATQADLLKTGLTQLLAHRPTHLIFDFIDERFDLLRLPTGALITHSWELESGGYLDDPALAGATAIPRLSGACERLWRESVVQLAGLLSCTVLRNATIILHSARWAKRQIAPGGTTLPLQGDPHIWDGRPADLAKHNQMLARYESHFLQTIPQAQVIAAQPEHQLADPAHRWGLSPFHYVPGYYDDILAALDKQGAKIAA